MYVCHGSCCGSLSPLMILTIPDTIQSNIVNKTPEVGMGSL